MKKAVAFLLILSCLLLAGCNNRFWQSSVDKLCKMGYVITVHADTEEELASSEKSITAGITLSGAEMFDFKLLEVVTFSNGDEQVTFVGCTLMRFKNSTQAKQYQSYYTSTRTQGNEYKVAVKDNVAVLCNDPNAQIALGVQFK